MSGKISFNLQNVNVDLTLFKETGIETNIKCNNCDTSVFAGTSCCAIGIMYTPLINPCIDCGMVMGCVDFLRRKCNSSKTVTFNFGGSANNTPNRITITETVTTQPNNQINETRNNNDATTVTRQPNNQPLALPYSTNAENTMNTSIDSGDTTRKRSNDSHHPHIG